jgi:hypothetical protein
VAAPFLRFVPSIRYANASPSAGQICEYAVGRRMMSEMLVTVPPP